MATRKPFGNRRTAAGKAANAAAARQRSAGASRQRQVAAGRAAARRTNARAPRAKATASRARTAQRRSNRVAQNARRTTSSQRRPSSVRGSTRTSTTSRDRPSVRSIHARVAEPAQEARDRQRTQRDAVKDANKLIQEKGGSFRFQRVQAFARDSDGNFVKDAKGQKVIIPFATEIIRVGGATARDRELDKVPLEDLQGLARDSYIKSGSTSREFEAALERRASGKLIGPDPDIDFSEVFAGVPGVTNASGMGGQKQAPLEGGSFSSGPGGFRFIGEFEQGNIRREGLADTAPGQALKDAQKTVADLEKEVATMQPLQYSNVSKESPQDFAFRKSLREDELFRQKQSLLDMNAAEEDRKFRLQQAGAANTQSVGDGSQTTAPDPGTSSTPGADAGDSTTTPPGVDVPPPPGTIPPDLTQMNDSQVPIHPHIAAAFGPKFAALQGAEQQALEDAMQEFALIGEPNTDRFGRERDAAEDKLDASFATNAKIDGLARDRAYETARSQTATNMRADQLQQALFAQQAMQQRRKNAQNEVLDRRKINKLGGGHDFSGLDWLSEQTQHGIDSLNHILTKSAIMHAETADRAISIGNNLEINLQNADVQADIQYNTSYNNYIEDLQDAEKNYNDDKNEKRKERLKAHRRYSDALTQLDKDKGDVYKDVVTKSMDLFRDLEKDARIQRKDTYSEVMRYISTFGTTNKGQLRAYEQQLQLPPGTLSSQKTLAELRLYKTTGAGTGVDMRSISQLIEADRTRLATQFPDMEGEEIDKLVINREVLRLKGISKSGPKIAAMADYMDNNNFKRYNGLLYTPADGSSSFKNEPYVINPDTGALVEVNLTDIDDFKRRLDKLRNTRDDDEE